MRGKLAKRIRKLIYNTTVGNDDSHRRVAPGLSMEETALYFAQRAVYLRAKKIIARDPQVNRVDMFADTARGVLFLAKAVENKLKEASIPEEDPSVSPIQREE